MELVAESRSLGAPIALEIDDDQIIQWKVGGDDASTRQWDSFPPEAIQQVFRHNAEDWSPQTVLRAKNITAKLRPRQLDFIDLGLLPALEHHVRDKLDRLLRAVHQSAVETYKQSTGHDPDAQQLFRLVFRLVAAKVLCDRRVHGFRSINDFSDADGILERVGQYYHQDQPVLDDPTTRQLVADRLWESVSFENLSVETLAYIYETTLVDEDVRGELGTHSTPSSIARYIVSRVLTEDLAHGQLRIVEPCSGHGIFLVAALERLRDLLPFDLPPQQRHQFFVRALRGFEKDSFAWEISRLCLMLADFPFPNGWKLNLADVFDSPPFESALKRADVVLCNPPFENFTQTERKQYGSLRSVQKPAELLHRVLDNLNPTGILGFVLPRQFLDGTGYRDVRERLARRYEQLEIVTLPDRVFHISQLETCILVAKSPSAHHERVQVSFAEVSDADRVRFLSDFLYTRKETATKPPSGAAVSLRVSPLGEVWQRLSGCTSLGEVARIHRGVEWQPPFDEAKYVANAPRRGFKQGLHKISVDFQSFHSRTTKYLSTRPQDRRRNAFDLPWDQQKVILNAARVSRGAWRLAAVPDCEGLICSQRFFGIWPKNEWTITSLAAVLNAPVANAFIAANEGQRDNRKTTVARIPLPDLSAAEMRQLDVLVEEYRRLAAEDGSSDSMCQVLLQIDAVVLRGYALPPRLEREVLDFFSGHQRRVPFEFTEYFPRGFTPNIPLWMYVSEDFQRCNSHYLLETVPEISDPALVDALAEVE
ncbi:MAG: SAM-dependent DNA methyltransferase [Planctomycetes bacterium]|nr:SAM-dependent DNA methyltransferase [Planctomycetota bacterium]